MLELLLLEAIEQDQKRHTTMKSNNKSIMTTSQQDCPIDAILPSTIEFLDHFPESQDAVIACARKCEAEVWPTLFELVGSPRDLFNVSFNRRELVLLAEGEGSLLSGLSGSRTADTSLGVKFVTYLAYAGSNWSDTKGEYIFHHPLSMYCLLTTTLLHRISSAY